MSDDALRRRIVACIGEALEALGALDGAGTASTGAGPAELDEGLGLFGQGIGLDSIEALRIVTAVEERFGVAIADEDLDPDHFRTVGSLAGFFAERIP